MALAAPSPLTDELAVADPGATIRLRDRDLAGLRGSATWTGGKLLVFSGRASGPSRLYEDRSLAAATAPNRVLFSVANAAREPLRFAVRITNLTAAPGVLTLLRAGASTPASRPRRAIERWLNGAPGAPVVVAAGSTVWLDPLFGDAPVAPGARVLGIWDYTFERVHSVQLCALPADGSASCAPLPLAPRDGQLRGTFPWNERLIEVAQLEPRAASLPLSTVEQRGVDVPTGETVALANNLGVLRRVELPALGGGAPNLALLLSGRTLGAAARASAGITPGGAVLLPDALPVGAAALLGTFAPDDGPMSVEYLPAPDATSAELVALPF